MQCYEHEAHKTIDSALCNLFATERCGLLDLWQKGLYVICDVTNCGMLYLLWQNSFTVIFDVTELRPVVFVTKLFSSPWIMQLWSAAPTLFIHTGKSSCVSIFISVFIQHVHCCVLCTVCRYAQLCSNAADLDPVGSGPVLWDPEWFSFTLRFWCPSYNLYQMEKN